MYVCSKLALQEAIPCSHLLRLADLDSSTAYDICIRVKVCSERKYVIATETYQSIKRRGEGGIEEDGEKKGSVAPHVSAEHNLRLKMWYEYMILYNGPIRRF